MPTEPPATRTEPPRSERPLCAYSPRWLSGPTPAYEGLVATVEPPDDDGDGNGCS